LEYEHIVSLVGAEQFVLTNMPKNHSEVLRSYLSKGGQEKDGKGSDGAPAAASAKKREAKVEAATTATPTAAVSGSFSSASSPLLFPRAVLSASVDQVIAGGGVSSSSKLKSDDVVPAFLSAIDRKRVCFLDLRADRLLSPDDRDRFDCYVFGGILGSDPPTDRGARIRAMGFETRHLGEKQMTTDTAVLVVRLVVESAKPIASIEFIDDPDAETGESTKEVVSLPFRYVRSEATGGPVMPAKMPSVLASSLDVSLAGMLDSNQGDISLDGLLLESDPAGGKDDENAGDDAEDD